MLLCNSIFHPRKSSVVPIKLLKNRFILLFEKSQSRNQKHFLPSIFEFAGHMASVATVQFCCFSVKTATDDMEVVDMARMGFFSLTPTLDGNFLTFRCWHFIYDMLFVIDSYKLCITIKTVLISLQNDQYFNWENILMFR